MLDSMKAAIFDMDGTLLDSMPSWRGLNVAYVRNLGFEPTPKQEEDLYSLTGMLVIPYLKENFGVDADFGDMLERAVGGMEPVYLAGIAHKPGAAAYLERLGKRGVKRVVATATPARLALTALNASGLTPYLDYIYSTEMLGGSKREAKTFDRLCELIGEEKKDCVMFEDALYAMRGAKAAGLRVAAIRDLTSARDEAAIREIADVYFESYDELE